MNNHLFHFHTSEVSPHNKQTDVVHVPKGVDDKQSLLQLIATMLRFPAYFGYNWDALDECLADLSWIQNRVVWIWHEDIPLASNPSEAQHYLRVLDGILRKPGSVSVQVSFPESAREKVQSLLT
jgi:hypothetical protein